MIPARVRRTGVLRNFRSDLSFVAVFSEMTIIVTAANANREANRGNPSNTLI